MAETFNNFSSNPGVKIRAVERVVAAWVVVSFLASLIVCCDLFAAEADSATDHHHFHFELKSVKDSKDGKDDCVSANMPDLADSKSSLAGWPAPAEITFLIKAADLTEFGANLLVEQRYGPDPPPPPSPFYLLFHRLLIAHLFA